MVNILQRARALGMSGGDYVFFYYTLLPDDDFDMPPWLYGVDEDLSPGELTNRRQTFYPLKMVRLKWYNEIHLLRVNLYPFNSK